MLMARPRPDGFRPACRSLHVHRPLFAVTPHIPKVAPRLPIVQEFAPMGLAFHQAHILDASVVNEQIQYDMAI